MNYVSAREGIPVPTKPYERAGRAEWVVCSCGHKGRPGAFHVHLEPSESAPVVAPKPKPAKKAKPRKRLKPSGSRVCKCGKPIEYRTVMCRACRNETYERPECGTVAGYSWHRRQWVKDPANNPWPLPVEDACGCRTAYGQRFTRKKAA